MPPKRRLTDEERIAHRNETSRRWYAKNVEKVAAKTRNWQKKYPERAAMIAKKWRDKHPEGVRASESRRYNKPEKAALHSLWKKDNPEKVAAYNKTWYDVTHAGQRQRAAHGRKKPKRCDICKKTDRVICFDHCHKTGLFRGWLCAHCNTALGYVNDSPKLLHKMIVYLEAFNAERKKKK